jgi:NAD(P) transhydrogenase subunit beta
LIVGAHRVTHLAAQSGPSSLLSGRPILEVEKARTLMAIKRSMNPGFADIDTPLHDEDKTLMPFGDARDRAGDIVRELRFAST